MDDRTRALLRDERGAIAIVVLFMAVFLVAALFYLIDIGSSLLYRERMQEAADAAAFSSAVIHARGMNILALINMIMAALLAVLVALNLIEMVIVVGMAAVAACIAISLGTCTAAASALPPLEEARNTVSSIRDNVRSSVLSGLSMLHTAERGVRLFIPYASELAVWQTVEGHYSPPVKLGFAVPPRAVLPTVDDSYTELCGRAGDYVARLAMVASTHSSAVRGTAREHQGLLQREVRRLRLQVLVVDVRRSFTGEDAGHPREGIAEAPDGVRDARSNQQARL